jgi:hypothetical protein
MHDHDFPFEVASFYLSPAHDLVQGEFSHSVGIDGRYLGYQFPHESTRLASTSPV